MFQQETKNSLVSRVRGSLQCFLEKIMEGDFIKLTGTKLQEPQRKRPKSVKVKPEKEALRRCKNAQKVAVLGEKDSSVRLLEELVFGSEDQLLDSLGQEEEPGSTLLLDDCSDEDEGSGDSEEEEQQPIKRAAWIDKDDETEEQVDLTNRFRRDFIKGDESTLSKSGLQQRMREKFQSAMGGTPAWAQLHQNTAKQKKKKKKEAEEDSDEDQEDLTRRTGNYITASQNLPPGVLKMKKCLNVNSARVSNDRLTSVQFHPRAQVAMMTGLDQSLCLFQVDGKSNPLIQSVFLERFPVHRASFSSDGLTVIATSFRNKLFYLYHMMEGKVTPVHSVRGLNEARVKEFSVCPVEDTVLLSGTRGYLHLLTLKTNEVVRSLKMNGEVCGAVFSPDGSRVFSSSEDGQVYVWDVSSARCLHRFTDDGCVKATSIAASPNGRYLACGSQSGVVNIYSQESCLNSSEPKPLRAVMNLLTPATTLTFNPTSEILALGSRSEDEAVRLLHVPSLSVFSNFPLSKRKVCYRVQDLAFSPNSGFLCLVNNKGHAPLYRLLHYQDF